MLQTEGRGRAFVLIHGWSDSADTWSQVMAMLAREGRRAVAVDLPGFGQASATRTAQFVREWDDFVEGVVERVAQESGQPVVLVGNSLGGYLTLRALERNSPHVAGGVGVAPAGAKVARVPSLAGLWPVHQAMRAITAVAPEGLRRGGVTQMFKFFAFHEGRAATSELLGAFGAHHHNIGVSKRTVNYIRPLLKFMARHRPASPLARLLLVWGRRDRLLLHEGAADVLQRMPAGRLETYEACGHCPQLEMPARLVGDLVKFAAEIDVELARKAG